MKNWYRIISKYDEDMKLYCIEVRYWWNPFMWNNIFEQDGYNKTFSTFDDADDYLFEMKKKRERKKKKEVLHRTKF